MYCVTNEDFVDSECVMMKDNRSSDVCSYGESEIYASPVCGNEEKRYAVNCVAKRVLFSDTEVLAGLECLAQLEMSNEEAEEREEA